MSMRGTCLDCPSSLSGAEVVESSTTGADFTLRFLFICFGRGAGFGGCGDLARERKLRAGASSGNGTFIGGRGIESWC